MSWQSCNYRVPLDTGKVTGQIQQMEGSTPCTWPKPCRREGWVAPKKCSQELLLNTRFQDKAHDLTGLLRALQAATSQHLKHSQRGANCCLQHFREQTEVLSSCPTPAATAGCLGWVWFGRRSLVCHTWGSTEGSLQPICDTPCPAIPRDTHRGPPGSHRQGRSPTHPLSSLKSMQPRENQSALLS